ncbi:hypothetical protein OHB26_18650 [Nocardia sp. NBC_01503]|uniref:hypothetical protein n=1 Tax=Nocardia sp. NBC_01503 TaxID=2975997 RepID=UPI002E7BD56E|nr:hypothetical protein [Nocardia sp. NBC_01503]WTL36033.1 hypothetical protein OHB26_18650 [Nocardia sp. NBC_01503]
MNTTAALPDSAWPTLANSSAGWGDRTVPQRFSGTPVPLPRGKGLGGSSAMLDSGYFTAAADVEAVVAGIEAARAITDPAALQAMFDKALGPKRIH